jgi:hypothetical protein
MIKPGNSIRVYDTEVANRDNFFTGFFNNHQDQLANSDPFIAGYSFVFWVKLPFWVEQEFPGFKAMTQKTFKNFSGLSDMDLSTVSIPQGFAANEYHVASELTKGNTEFSISYQELSGSPIKNAFQFWVTGIRDPETGLATYPKQYNVDYSAKNHTGELLYVVTRPDADNFGMKNIEFAAYYTAVMPKRIPLSHLNHTQGSHDPVEIEIPFSGTLHLSGKVDDFARDYLETNVYKMEYTGMFNPETDELQTEIFGSTKGSTI